MDAKHGKWPKGLAAAAGHEKQLDALGLQQQLTCFEAAAVLTCLETGAVLTCFEAAAVLICLETAAVLTRVETATVLTGLETAVVLTCFEAATVLTGLETAAVLTCFGAATVHRICVVPQIICSKLTSGVGESRGLYLSCKGPVRVHSCFCFIYAQRLCMLKESSQAPFWLSLLTCPPLRMQLCAQGHKESQRRGSAGDMLTRKTAEGSLSAYALSPSG
eukprot:1159898-Pelagomonas_calceolata.AAC.7